ncbi:MAG: GFA family protein [Alphaproteobacteria bacterium]
MPNLTGGCLCGRARYSLSGEPAFSGLCHCRNCQRYTGSAFEAVIAFPSASVSIQGDLKTYNDTGDSGQQVRRRFCPNCGSGVVAEADILPGVSMVLAGTLDDPAAFTPAMEIYSSSAQSWVHAGGERSRFEKMPPSP